MMNTITSTGLLKNKNIYRSVNLTFLIFCIYSVSKEAFLLHLVNRNCFVKEYRL
jgi:hypothetical protein